VSNELFAATLSIQAVLIQYLRRSMSKKLLRSLLIVLLAGLLLASCAMGPRAESTPGISAGENQIFVSYLNYVYEIDPANGIATWRYPEKSNIKQVFYAPALIDGESIYVGDFANDLLKINVSGTPTVEWIFSEAKGWYQGKAAKDGNLIIAPNSDRNIYAIDETNTLVWIHHGDFAYISEPLIVDDMVIVSSQDRKVVFLNKADGTTIREVELNGAVIAPPFYDTQTDSVFVGSLAGEFVRIDRQSGEIVWSFDDSGTLGSVWAEPILVDGQLIFNDKTGKIFSLSPETGLQNWQFIAGGSMPAGLAWVEGKGFVVALEDGTITLYGMDRQAIWSRIVSGSVYNTPVVTETMVLVGAIKGDNLVYAFDFQGQPVWTFKPEK